MQSKSDLETSRESSFVIGVGLTFLLAGDAWIVIQVLGDVFLTGTYYTGWRLFWALVLVGAGHLTLIARERLELQAIPVNKTMRNIAEWFDLASCLGTIAILGTFIFAIAARVYAFVRHQPLSYTPWTIPIAMVVLTLTAVDVNYEFNPNPTSWFPPH